MADSVLAVMLEANRIFVDELEGEDDMYEESLFKILEPRLPALLERENGIYESLFKILEPKLPIFLESAAEKARKEGIQGTVDVLRGFGHEDKEIKAAIMEKYSLSPEKADEFLQSPANHS